MNWEAVTAIAEVIGVIAVVVSLLYVGYQVRQNTLQLRQDNLRETVRGTLDTNWFFHRNEEAFNAFRSGLHSFHGLDPKQKALFHSIVVDLSFYFEIVRKMEMAGLVERSALETNRRFLVAVLVTPGGREWLQFAEDTQPMPAAALEYLRSVVDTEGGATRPITDLQPWFADRK